MAAKTWTLTDAERNMHVEQATVGSADIPGVAAHWEVSKRTLRGGLQDGMEVIDVDNGWIRFTVLPTRGMGIWRLAGIDGQHVGWRSPVDGPVHPKFVPLAEPSGLGWLDGFDEFLCRCGLVSNGAPEFDDRGQLRYGLHGRIANRPAHRVDVAYDMDSGEIIVRGVVDETRFLQHNLRLTTTIRTRPGESGLRITDEVTNRAATPGEMQLLYHVNFGGALLDAGAKLLVPVKTLVPRNDRAAEGVREWNRYAAAQPGFVEQVYLLELAADAQGNTKSLLVNAHGTLAAGLSFNTRQLPCFTVWKNTAAAADGYVTGLEPGTNFPNPRSHEKANHRVVPLGPGESKRFDLQLKLYADATAVADAQRSIAALQAGVQPTFFDQPQPGWCAGV
jgi:hypothetical protein